MILLFILTTLTSCIATSSSSSAYSSFISASSTESTSTSSSSSSYNNSSSSIISNSSSSSSSSSSKLDLYFKATFLNHDGSTVLITSIKVFRYFFLSINFIFITFDYIVSYFANLNKSYFCEIQKRLKCVRLIKKRHEHFKFNAILILQPLKML